MYWPDVDHGGQDPSQVGRRGTSDGDTALRDIQVVIELRANLPKIALNDLVTVLVTAS